jgi:hypothetical protein
MDPTPNVITLQMIETAVTAICALIVAFRPGSLTDDQRNAILGAIAAAYVIIIAVTEMVRQRVQKAALAIKRAAFHYGVEQGQTRHAGLGGVLDAPVTPTFDQLAIYANEHPEEVSV